MIVLSLFYLKKHLMKRTILIFLFLLLIQSKIFSAETSVVTDSVVYVKSVNYYSNVKDKEHFYDHFVRILAGDKYSKHESYLSLRRLQELKQFDFVKLVEEFEGDSVNLNYYINEARKYELRPFGSFLSKPDTVLNQAYLTLSFTVKNNFKNNTDVFFRIYYGLPIGYTNLPTFITGLSYHKFTVGVYNNYISKYFLSASLSGEYEYISSSQKWGVDERLLSVYGDFGKRFDNNKLSMDAGYLIRKSFFPEDENSLLSHNRYPKFALNWEFDNKDAEHYYSERSMFKASLIKYGLPIEDSLGVDYFKGDLRAKFITSFKGFKFLTNLYVQSLFFINDISLDQYLYVGGLSTNRGYVRNSIPNVDESDLAGVGGKYFDGFQAELRHSLFRFGPHQNFFLGYLTAFVDAGIWVDYTRVLMPSDTESKYYSYGGGLRFYFSRIKAYWNVDASMNKSGEFLLSVTNGMNF